MLHKPHSRTRVAPSHESVTSAVHLYGTNDLCNSIQHRMSTVAGTWPAAWMLPTTDKRWCSGCSEYGDGWCLGGEIGERVCGAPGSRCRPLQLQRFPASYSVRG